MADRNRGKSLRRFKDPLILGKRYTCQGHSHIGELVRPWQLLFDVFNPYFVLNKALEVANNSDSRVLRALLLAEELEKIKVWTLYVEKFAALGIAPNALFLDTDGCSACAWLSGDEDMAPFLDSRHYRLRNLDVLAENSDPLSHWLLHGLEEGRRPSMPFKMRFYNPGEGISLERAAQSNNVTIFLRLVFDFNSIHLTNVILHGFYNLRFCDCKEIAVSDDNFSCRGLVDDRLWGR